MRDDIRDNPPSGIIRPTRNGCAKTQRAVASLESVLCAAAWLPRGYCLADPGLPDDRVLTRPGMVGGACAPNDEGGLAEQQSTSIPCDRVDRSLPDGSA